jgi:MFS family permease
MNETEINMACPRCGAVVNIDLIRCPECGLEFYPEESAQEFEHIPSKTNGLLVVGAILLGVFISAIIAFIFYFITSLLFPGAYINSVGSIILFIAGPLGAFVGGYVTSSLSRWKPYLSTCIVSILTIPFLMLLNTRWQTSSITTNNILDWTLVILAAPASAYLHSRFKQGIKWPNWSSGSEEKLYNNLLVKARFDRERTDRLIAYEKRRNPYGTRIELIQSAIDRWERDNR